MKVKINCFAVIDTEMGILDTLKENIQAAFSQSDNSTTKIYGTGLGLTTSNQLVVFMNSQLH
jgi:K+-sensing histidine kinase KdpD